MKDPNLLNDHCYQFQKVTNLIKNKAGFISAHTPTVGAAVYTSAAICAQRIHAHTLTLAIKVQTCWTFKASADQHRHSSQSRKRSKVTEGWLVVLHRDVCGHIPMHTLACLYFYPWRNLHYAVAMRRQPQTWTSVLAAGAYARMEYKPGLRDIWISKLSQLRFRFLWINAQMLIRPLWTNSIQAPT